MANERAAGEGELLAASVAEQLREKSDTEKQAERERRAADERAATVERHKQAEREAVAKHGGDPETFRAAKAEARTRPVRRRRLTTEQLMMIGLGVLVMGRMLLGRLR